MRSLMRYGGLAVVCGVLTSACGGDPSGERPTAGGPSSGNGGAGGSAGQTGATGGRGGGAATGVGGTGSTTEPACAGCVELAVTISADQYKSVQYVFRTAAPGADLSTAVVTWKVRALTPASEIPGDRMFVAPFATNGMANNYAGAFAPQTALTVANGFTDSNTWVDVTLDFKRIVATAPTDGTPPAATDAGVDGGMGAAPAPAPGGAFIVSMMDKTVVSQVGLQLGTIAAFTGTGSVRIAVDSVTVTGLADATVFPSKTFAAGLEGLVQNDFQVPAGTPMPVFRP